jgi:FkbM family methyltransferase
MGEETVGGFRWRDDLKAWWPDYDHDPVRCMQFVRHGLPAIDAAVRYCRGWHLAVQAGGHAGFWPKRLAELFLHVYTFEPEPILFECLRRNCQAPNVAAFKFGLGAAAGRVPFKSHVSAGSWRVDPAGESLVTLMTVDALALDHCDAIFLDIEGYEVEALRGAEQTIERFRPVILCELLPRSKDSIDKWLQAHGYRLVERYGRDGIYTSKRQP